MKKLASTPLNMLAVLTIIAVIAACVLAYVNNVTSQQIEKINQENLQAGIKAVMGSDDIVVSEPETVEAFTAYSITDAQGASLGKAVVSVSNGFGGPLKVLVGFDNEGTILGYTVLEHAETPGLGAKAGEWFQDKIVGKNPGQCNFTVSKDGGDIDAITASTITSRAFLLAIQSAYDKIIAGTDATTSATQQAKQSDCCSEEKSEDCCGEEAECCKEQADCCDEKAECCKEKAECCKEQADCCKE